MTTPPEHGERLYLLGWYRGASCISALAAKPPTGPDWVHEIKHDGYRPILRQDGKTVRLFTRRGHDWSDRYPAIAAVAAKLRAKSFTLDGEAAVSGADGVAVLDRRLLT